MKKILVISLGIIWIWIAPGCRDSGRGPVMGSDSLARQGDPLPSWADGNLKRSIIQYVQQVTNSNDKGFIPEDERIATFDNDGTLWAEKPYVQELFAFYRVRKMAAADPRLAKKQPFKAVLENDMGFFARGGEKALMGLVGLTHAGLSEGAFEQSVQDFFATATYPGRNVPVRRIVYQPQLELLRYLRANGFKTFICTGGTVEFVRGISWPYYGIPKDQVIGTSFRYRWDDTGRDLFREPGIDHINDKEGKPAGIQLHIGGRPVFACGNEGGAGDIAMLEFCQGSTHPSYQLIVNHDDSAREYFYQEKDNASMGAAARNGWHVVSMKNDWTQIFPAK
jgi:hypothetical protein